MRTLLITSMGLLFLSCGRDLPLADPPPHPPSKPTHADCPFSTITTADAVLAITVGPQVSVIAGDGTATHVYTFGAERTLNPATVFAGVQTNGDFAVAQAQDDQTTWGEVVLFDRTGKVRWHAGRDYTRPAQYVFGRTFLGDDGELAVAGFNPQGGGALVHADGTLVALGVWNPLGPIGTDGWLPVGGGTPYTTGWLHPADGAMADPVSNATRVVQGNWRAVYVAQRQGQAVLVSERPGDVKELPLTLGPVPSDEISVREIFPNGTVLLRTFGQLQSNLPDLWLADFDTAQVTRFSVELPAGFRRFAYSGPVIDLSFDETGAALLALRDDDSAGVFRSIDFGKSWSRLGRGFRDVNDARGTDHHGTYVVQGELPTTALYSFAPAPDEVWPATSADPTLISGTDSSQLVRLDEGLVRVAPHDSVAGYYWRNDGWCAVALQQAESPGLPHFESFDLELDARSEFALDGPPIPAHEYLALQVAWF